MNRLIRNPKYTWEGCSCSFLSHLLKMSVGIRSCCSSLPCPFNCSMHSTASINIFSASIAGPPWKITQYKRSAPDTYYSNNFYQHKVVLLRCITDRLQDHLCSLQVILALVCEKHSFLLDSLHTACERKDIPHLLTQPRYEDNDAFCIIKIMYFQ